MSIIRPKPAFTDKRGTITDILVNELIDSVVFIKSNKGAIRGNHYHKQTFQWTYVLRGKLKVSSYLPNESKTPTIEQTVSTGEMILHIPNERHAFLALEDSECVVLTRGPRRGNDYESDTFRLDTPLL